MKKLLISCSLIMILVGCNSKTSSTASINGCNETANDGTCSIKEKEKKESSLQDYTELDINHHKFKEITMEQAIQFIETKQTGILYIGFPACVWCQEAVPVLNQAAIETNQEILYANKRAPSTTSEQIKTMEHLLDPILKTDENDQKVLFVPEVIVFKDGKIIDHHLSTWEEHNAHERKMTDDEKTRLQQRYLEMFEKLK